MEQSKKNLIIIILIILVVIIYLLGYMIGYNHGIIQTNGLWELKTKNWIAF